MGNTIAIYTIATRCTVMTQWAWNCHCDSGDDFTCLICWGVYTLDGHAWICQGSWMSLVPPVVPWRPLVGLELSSEVMHLEDSSSGSEGLRAECKQQRQGFFS